MIVNLQLVRSGGLYACISACCLFADVSDVSAQEVPLESEETTDIDQAYEMSDQELARLLAEGEEIEIVAKDPPPGSAHAIGEEELERFEHDDIHKVLSAIPGVYIREEDGYGLRPNIGMRGSGSERSAKITLMEDGILSAPAPYAAPAAYYFPLVTRMSRVEVLKGPASIQYGPATVGGALNLVSRSIPREQEATIDIAGGSDAYRKGHASFGKRWRNIGFLMEAARLRSSGFKILDGGGDTGFIKNDFLLKLHGNTDLESVLYQEWNAKLGFSNEASNETYTGLTDKDFDESPQRRYAGTQLDRMNWNHLQLQLSHRLEVVKWLFNVTTTAYRNTFFRKWRKLSGFRGKHSLRDILQNSMSGNNAVFYSVLTGDSDSSSEAEALLVGTNARDFVSQGIQSVGQLEYQSGALLHNLEIGVRLHSDRVVRRHTAEGYFMREGELISDGIRAKTTRDTISKALALAFHVQDNIEFNKFQLTVGMRSENIETRHHDKAEAGLIGRNREFALIPGAGITYQATEGVGFLLGVHRGFAPTAPGPDDSVLSEKSMNYEMGTRLAFLGLEAEVVGFLSDYSNLKGSCTFSTGCQESEVGDEFNGGHVKVFGAEVSANSKWEVKSVRFPFQLSYTFNHARFQSAFTSSNPQWGQVETGDVVPYLPAHQFSLSSGIGAKRWELIVSGVFTSAMRDVAGQGAVEASQATDSSAVFNFAAHYTYPKWGKMYVTLNNAFGQVHVVSKRPYGSRPGIPRMLIVGYKNTF